MMETGFLMKKIIIDEAFISKKIKDRSPMFGFSEIKLFNRVLIIKPTYTSRNWWSMLYVILSEIITEKNNPKKIGVFEMCFLIK